LNDDGVLLGDPYVERKRLPKPVKTLRGVIVVSRRSYALTDTGELWAWGLESELDPLGHGDDESHPLPEPIELLFGFKVDAVAARQFHTLALEDDGSVHVWGGELAVRQGALGVGPASAASRAVRGPQCIPAECMACGP
jgi:alpha-tubulin suppressor-like RCC1 family protein